MGKIINGYKLSLFLIFLVKKNWFSKKKKCTLRFIIDVEVHNNDRTKNR